MRLGRRHAFLHLSLKRVQQKAGVMMQTKQVSRLSGGVFKLLLSLITLLVAQQMFFITLIRMMRRNKRLRAKVFRFFNSITRPFAGRRFSPYGILQHTGRRSQQTYMTPLVVFPFGDGFVLTLTYGPDVDWCRNVMASGKCILTWKGQEYALEKPEILPISEVQEAYPLPTRLIGRAGGVQQCLWLHKQSMVPEKDRVPV
jgi:deazaflavin-dependent oxidoreductase (nitroreductase family)